MKKTSLFIAVTFAAILAACTGQNNPPITPEVSVPDSSLTPSDPLTATLSAQDRDRKPKMDWLDAIEVFAQKFPTYAGYSFSSDRKQLIFYTSATDKKAERAEEMREEFVELIGKTTGFPEVTDAQGNTIQVKKLKYTIARVKYPFSKIYKWRIALRDLLSTNLVNKMSINDEGNLIRLQIAAEVDRVSVMNFMVQKGIPSDVVSINIGENAFSKTLYDTFTPPAGGVNVRFSGSNCSLGLPVLVDNVSSYLIASHCSNNWGTSNDGTVLTQNSVTIGNKGADNAFYTCASASIPNGSTCQNADTSIYTAVGSFSRGRIIFTTGGTFSITTASANGDTYFDVTAVAERVGQGETVNSIGSTTGFRDAIVLNADTDLVYRGNPPATAPARVIKRVTEVVRPSTNGPVTCQGDSGGPWFQITAATTAKFLGITSGITINAPQRTRFDGITVNCGYNAFFTPVAQIRVAYPGKVFTFTR
jgi:hypothetical protein